MPLSKKAGLLNFPIFSEEQAIAFESLKGALAKPPILHLPRSDLPLSVDTDAFEYHVGSVFIQMCEDGTRCPIGFRSQSFCPAERKHSVSENGCLAVVWATQILRPYLERRHFEL